MTSVDNPVQGPARVITIDGPAGVGKSSVARRIARELGYCYLDTGAMYRAVTYALLRSGLVPEPDQGPVDPAALESGVREVLEDLALHIDASGRVWLAGAEVTDQLRTEAVTRLVSPVSALPAVRQVLVELQRRLAHEFTADGQGLVVEGRDTGSYVFPAADRSFFLDASMEERARRRKRQEEAKGGRVLELSVWMQRLRDRDELDRGRALAPLCVPPGAEVIDSSELDEDGVVGAILEKLRS